MPPDDATAAGPERAALSANVAQTARTVITVLETFGESLRRGGLEQAVASYRQLADTVVNQRLWALNHQDRSADESFARIAEEAGRIGGLLRHYVGVMDKLAAMNALAADAPEALQMATDLPPADRAIVDWLATRGAAASATQIRSGTRLPTAQITPALARLAARGVLRKAGTTGRFLYSLNR